MKQQMNALQVKFLKNCLRLSSTNAGGMQSNGHGIRVASNSEHDV